MQEKTLSVLRKGSLYHQGRILKKDNILGEDMLLNAPELIEVTPALSLTNVQMLSLSRRHLEETLDSGNYWAEARAIRRAAVRLAVIRAVLLAARRAKSLEEGHPALSQATSHRARSKGEWLLELIVLAKIGQHSRAANGGSQEKPKDLLMSLRSSSGSPGLRSAATVEYDTANNAVEEAESLAVLMTEGLKSRQKVADKPSTILNPKLKPEEGESLQPPPRPVEVRQLGHVNSSLNGPATAAGGVGLQTALTASDVEQIVDQAVARHFKKLEVRLLGHLQDGFTKVLTHLRENSGN